MPANSATAMSAQPDPDRQTPWGTERPFAPGVRTFHERLASADWPKLAPSFVFVRDYEGLPARAPFDIDAMADTDDLQSCRAVFEETAEALGLVCLVQAGSAGINILVLELTHAPAYRTWSYFEIATHKKLARDFTVLPREMTIERTGGLPVPSNAWRFATNLLQALRRSNLDRYQAVLKACLRDTPDCWTLAAEKLGLDKTGIDEILASAKPLTHWQDRLGVTVKPPKPAAAPRSWRNRLRLAALRRLYVMSSKELYLISVHGADGVGKSTACERVAGMFAGYPIGLDAFHHVTSWKHKTDRSTKAGPAATVETPPAKTSPLRASLKFGYRVSPEFVRDWWRAMTGYHHYGRSLNQKVFQGYLDHRIMILDRYVYDMFLKLGIRKAAGRLGTLVGYLACRFMRRPLRAVLIVDSPAAVIARKQELTLQEIDDYQTAMERLLRRLRVPHTVIQVSGRDADAVADELARAIIGALGTDLLQLMRYAVNPVSTP
jgi:hypothetical protein